MNRRARLSHAEGGEWAAELMELGFFGGLLQGDLPARLAARGWRLHTAELPGLPLLPLRTSAAGLAFVFPHSDAQTSAALAAQIGQPALQAACA